MAATQLLDSTMANVTIASHQYQRLLEKDEIRLLVLQPGHPRDHIRCSLRHVRLSSKPQYEALSYMWGPEENPMILDIDGNNRSVRNNLWHALRQLRSLVDERVLWIDALCIDQDNDKERSQQVSQISHIYAQAQSVRVWLGLKDDVSPEQHHNYQYRSPVRYIPSGTDGLFKKLCKRPYWSRLWIIQEIALATTIVIQYGHLACDWSGFNATLEKHSYSSSLFETAAHNVAATRRLQLESPNCTPLFEFYKTHRHAQCSDVRDKIFGLHSSSVECCRTATPIDYSMSVLDLCGKVLHHDYQRHSSTGERDIVIKSQRMLSGLGVYFSSIDNTRREDFFHEPNILVYGSFVARVVAATPPLAAVISTEALTEWFEDLLNMKRKKLRLIGADLERMSSWQSGAGLIYNIKSALENVRRTTTIHDSNNTTGGKPMDTGSVPAESVGDSLDEGDKNINHVMDLVMKSADLVQKDAAQDCVLFIGEGANSMRIGVAPVGTKVGDKLCEFQDSNVMAIVRSDKNAKHRFLGRIGEIFSSRYNWSGSKLSDIGIMFSIEDLQILTSMSSGEEPTW